MDPQSTQQTTTVNESIAEDLEVANDTNWKNALYEAKMKLSLENIVEKELTPEDKEAVSHLLLQRIAQAIKDGEMQETDTTDVTSYISSHLEHVTTDNDMKNLLYLLSKRWQFLSNIPSLVYEKPSVSSHDQIVQLAQGVT